MTKAAVTQKVTKSLPSTHINMSLRRGGEIKDFVRRKKVEGKDRHSRLGNTCMFR
jgi:hypothetical protein